MRVFERISPGVVLLVLVAGVGTLAWGLKFAIPFIIGLAAAGIGTWLDKYGLESDNADQG